MIISRTPYRISFFGGGTDYPQWFRNEGGAVLSTTIDKYCYITCRVLPPFFSMKHRVVWSHIETVSALSEILHPAVREGLRFMGFDDSSGLEIHHQGDLPARGGTGSSSSFSVGLINALTSLRNQTISKHDLALKAIELERNVLKEHVGSQDQVAAAYGGFNVIRFSPDGEIAVKPLSIQSSRVSELESRLMLFYEGSTRMSSEAALKIIENLPNKVRQLRRIQSMVDEVETILEGDGSLDAFGEMLHETWMLKRELSPVVTNSSIDDIYSTALAHGALGGKLMGAGVTGFLVFYVPLEKQHAVKTALSQFLPVPFKFENDGSRVVYNSPDEPWQ